MPRDQHVGIFSKIAQLPPATEIKRIAGRSARRHTRAIQGPGLNLRASNMLLAWRLHDGAAPLTSLDFVVVPLIIIPECLTHPHLPQKMMIYRLRTSQFYRSQVTKQESGSPKNRITHTRVIGHMSHVFDIITCHSPARTLKDTV